MPNFAQIEKKAKIVKIITPNSRKQVYFNYINTWRITIDI